MQKKKIAEDILNLVKDINLQIKETKKPKQAKKKKNHRHTLIKVLKEK